jgi:hypothetical protein
MAVSRVYDEKEGSKQLLSLIKNVGCMRVFSGATGYRKSHGCGSVAYLAPDSNSMQKPVEAIASAGHTVFCAFAYRKIEKPFKPLDTSQQKGNCQNMVKLNKTDQLVLDALKGGELTLQEIADKTGEKPKKIFKCLRKLFEQELVDTKARKYKLINKQ